MKQTWSTQFSNFGYGTVITAACARQGCSATGDDDDDDNYYYYYYCLNCCELQLKQVNCFCVERPTFNIVTPRKSYVEVVKNVRSK
jgi:hypothetical protein